MNNARRKLIAAARNALDDLKSQIETIKEEEQEAFDNMPESLQSGESGQKAEAAMDALDEAMSGIDEAIMNLETAEE